MDEIVINGVEYSFADVKVNLLGRDVVGIEAVEYGTSRDHKNIKGRGSRNVGMSRGGKDHEGSITLFQSEHEAVQARLKPGQDVTDLPAFPIVVSYAPEGGKIVTDIIKGCRVNKFKKGMKTDDGHQTIQWELTVFDIKYNA